MDFEYWYPGSLSHMEGWREMKGGSLLIWNEICPYANPSPSTNIKQLISRPGAPNVTSVFLALGKEVCVCVVVEGGRL